jgi:hypothetical protein
MSYYQYPLQMSFKILAFAPQIFIRDSSGRDICYVHQKLFKLKEDIGVYADSSKSRELFRLKADRIIDFSARYNLTNSTTGMAFGAIKREGMRSIWKASYNIFNESDQITHHIKEDNPFIKVLDAMLSDIPFAGMFINPTYTLYQAGTETPVLRIRKQPAFFEGLFQIEKMAEPAGEAEETRMLLGVLMMLLLERSRG